ncbi:MAG: hypothetical protein ABSE40_13560 [Candidatus Sulfotelmatobacter sp.]
MTASNVAQNEDRKEALSRCVGCDRPTDDCYIMTDGSIVCVECSELWEFDEAKQN